MASHPATGSRIQYVSDDIQFYPQRNYTSSTGNFARVKKLMATIPPPKLQPGKLILPKQDAAPRTNLAFGFKDYPAERIFDRLSEHVAGRTTAAGRQPLYGSAGWSRAGSERRRRVDLRQP